MTVFLNLPDDANAMRNPIISILLLVTALAGCTRRIEDRLTLVGGHIEHPSVKTITLSYGVDPLSWQPVYQVHAQLDASGNFRVELPGLATPTEAEVEYGDERSQLFLTPGDQLGLTVADPQRFDETIRFTGTGAPANNYLAQAYLRFLDDARDDTTPLASAATATPARMQSLVGAYQHQRVAFLHAYAALHPLPRLFLAYARQQLTFEAADNLLAYPVLRAYLAEHQLVPQRSPGPEEPLPATYYRFLTSLRPAQDSALACHNTAFLSFLESYVANQLGPGDRLPTGPELYACASQQFGTGRLRDLAVAKYLTHFVQAHDAALAVPLLAAFHQRNRDSTYARAVRGTYRAAWKVAAGQPAPSFTVRNARGQPVALADFAGHVVYLDFWPSWCGPCLAQMPASQTLQQRFAGQDVVFLYVSVDEHEAPWRRALAQHAPAGAASVHGWSPSHGFDGPLLKAYQIEGIPRYFLIGRDGRIRDGHAPTPSQLDASTVALQGALIP